MSHISMFLDESGDLGFDFSKIKTSKVFVVNILVCNNLETLDSFSYAVRRTIKNKININKKYKKDGELKASKTELSIKKYFYRQLPENNWGIYSYVLHKKKVYKHLRTSQG